MVITIATSISLATMVAAIMRGMIIATVAVVAATNYVVLMM